MKLKHLFKSFSSCAIYGTNELEIKGISGNSKNLKAGYLFVAKKGKTTNGAVYCQEAIQAGASAILMEKFDPHLPLSIVQIIHPQVADIEAELASIYHQFASQKLLMVAITGTNGKTTTSFIIQQLIEQFIGLCGLIGTIEYQVGNQKYVATHTTPDVLMNHQLLGEMVKQKCQAAVMEVTSHALVQKRVAEIDFDVALFTNLTRDHLDYHQNMEAYFQAKSLLFQHLVPLFPFLKKSKKWAVINQDSPWSSSFIEKCVTPVFTYGIDQAADLQGHQLQLHSQGTCLELSYQGEIIPCHWPLVGRFNVYNGLAAVATLLTQGFLLKEIVEKMPYLKPIKGRLEPVPNALNLKIFVDFAHSDDALKNVLETLREVQLEGKLIAVFGCGGNRDHSKRAEMAKICEQLADFVIVTSDNPRSEEPLFICEEIAKGFSKKACYQIEVDRTLAIHQAIDRANTKDVILIAGKGHEKTQVFAHHTLPFDDAEVAFKYCEEKFLLESLTYR